LYKKRSLPSGAPANDDRVRDAILYGRQNMPAFQYVLTDEQIDDLLAYLHTL
jgi:mono/diheme cytochrome c family protein